MSSGSVTLVEAKCAFSFFSDSEKDLNQQIFRGEIRKENIDVFTRMPDLQPSVSKGLKTVNFKDPNPDPISMVRKLIQPKLRNSSAHLESISYCRTLCPSHELHHLGPEAVLPPLVLNQAAWLLPALLPSLSAPAATIFDLVPRKENLNQVK
jgi:hypothetical protein